MLSFKIPFNITGVAVVITVSFENSFHVTVVAFVMTVSFENRIGTAVPIKQFFF